MEARQAELKSRAELEAVGRERNEAQARLSALQAEHESALLAAASQGASVTAARAPKVEAMAQMVRAQQAELTDSYRFAAACKLSVARSDAARELPASSRLHASS